MVIDAQRRAALVQRLREDTAARVLEVLQHCWRTYATTTAVRYHLLKAYNSWLGFAKQVLNEAEAVQLLRSIEQHPVWVGALQ